jgi:hypothetical protein
LAAGPSPALALVTATDRVEVELAQALDGWHARQDAQALRQTLISILARLG